MDKFIFLLSKQEISIERLHICTWSIARHMFFTEYGLEINRKKLKNFDIQMVLPLPPSLDATNFKSLYDNIIDLENCRFIFNADIENNAPINGQSPFGTRIDLRGDRCITALPLDLQDNVKIDPKSKALNITLDISNDQITEIIYIRFLIKTMGPAFSYEKKEITRRIITSDLRVNECRTASKDVIKLQQKGYKPIPINKCFCFHIIPNSYSIDFVDDKKLKTVRGLEATGFNRYLGNLKEEYKISLKEQDYNIIFCKQEKKQDEDIISYSFFSRYSKDYIGNVQIGIAVAANIICSLLFAFGSLYEIDYSVPLLCRLSIVHYAAIIIFIGLVIYLLHCRFWRKK